MARLRVFSTFAVGFCLITGGFGCASHTDGTAIDKQKLSDIHKGVTTRAQVEAVFGPPEGFLPMGNGKRVATWHYTDVQGHASAAAMVPIVGIFMKQGEATAQRQMLTVTYNDQDIVEDFAYSGSTTSREDGPMLSSETKTVAETPITPH